jgi:uncharacterized repeat protein (TIGR03843 family)
MEVKGRLPWSSNGTFLVELCLPSNGDDDQRVVSGVYKPGAGERALWDYPSGLFRRERAVYVVSEALGWGLVPETVLREGPLGPGSVQRFVAADFAEHYFTLLERPEHHDTLRAICLFDLLVNNGDRKSGHCLLGTDGRVWAIDHGLCLHDEPKLRTVIWDFAGQPLPPERVDDVSRLATAPPDELRHLLSADELDALVARATGLVRRPFFPPPRTQWSYPWPLV